MVKSNFPVSVFVNGCRIENFTMSCDVRQWGQLFFFFILVNCWGI